MKNEEKVIRVTQSSLPPYEEYIQEIKKCWENHWLTNMGEMHFELEKQLRQFLKVDFVSLTANGHMALELVLQAMELKGEVITTPFTFASTTHAIVRSGLTPVFCDIDPLTYTIDSNKIEELVTDKTSAILPVHVYGNICNVEAIDKIAKRYKLKVVYDAAHAMGVEYCNSGIAAYGDASVFSFHATKVFNTIEGGAVCSRNQNLYDKLYALKNFGITTEGVVTGIGANAKMNEFQAAMGLCNLRYLEEYIGKRKKIFEWYKERLDGISGLTLQQEQIYVKSNYAYFPIVVDGELFGEDRNSITDRLESKNIFARKYFYPLTSSFACYRNEFEIQSTPIAEEIAEKVLTLPLYPDLPEKDVDMICKIILDNH